MQPEAQQRRVGGRVALAALALALACGPVDAGREAVDTSEPLAYALCAADVAFAEVLAPRPPGERFAIAVQLGPEATKDLARLTERHLGRPLEIVAGDQLFLRGPIHAVIRSGLLVNTAFADAAEAERALATLQTALAESRCGAQPDATD